jgi:endonuclease/exonuclease/phosphatase family metal-dependent hydrolase
MTFSVLTLNLWNVSDPLAPRMNALSAGLKILRPDIVCLQEVGDDPRSGLRQSALAAAACGLDHAVDHEALSILSRYPVVRWQSALLPEAPRDEPRQVLIAECAVNGQPLIIANTHFAWRLEQLAERKAQAEAVLAAIAGFAGSISDKVLCGDFNDDPYSPAVRHVTASEFRDSYAVRHPDDAGFTFSLDNPHVHRGYPRSQRIDYVFISAALEPEACSIVFDGRNGLDLASDHYGVFCRLGNR